jgi:hypothetical protein
VAQQALAAPVLNRLRLHARAQDLGVDLDLTDGVKEPLKISGRVKGLRSGAA